MYEMLVFSPLEGEFDLEKAAAFLESLPFTFRDPGSGQSKYLLCGNAGATHYSRLKLLEPDSGYPYMCIVTLQPEEIRIAQTCDEDALEQAREVAVWIHENYRCRITDGDSLDLTALAAESVVALYE